VFVTAILAGCGSGSSLVATPTPGTVGPVIVFRDGAVVLYDVGAGRELRRGATPADVGAAVSVLADGWLGPSAYERSLPRAPEPPSTAPAAGATALASREHSGAYSSDGALLAFPVADRLTDPSVFKIVSAETGADVLSLPWENPYSDAHPGSAYFRGIPEPLYWRDDGHGVIVAGNSGIDGPTGWATVMLDGTVRTHSLGVSPLLSPTGRAAALIDDGLFSLSCDFQAENHRIRIRDLDNDADAGSIADPSRSLVPAEWSPDGEQLLYGSYATAPGDDGCPAARDQASVEWYVLSRRGGEPMPVPDRSALRASWYGDRAVEIVCADGSEEDLFLRCPQQQDRDQRRTLKVGGRTIATSARPSVLGFIDWQP
jgi:hypothetical protein